MEILESLGVALGLSALAGINLYLTVFVAGMAIHFGWVTLPPALQDLAVLGDPWIIGIAGVLYFLEFFADKVPWVDSANDAVHTVIRPLGGALLGVLALGEANAVAQVVAALLAGGVAASAHVAKAGARLVANASPEPVSNIGLSLGEDVLVLGGLGLIVANPLIAAAVVVVFVGAVWMILPRILRRVRTAAWLAGRTFGPAAGELPFDLAAEIERLRGTPGSPQATLACICHRGARLPRHGRGWLASFADGGTFFVGHRGGQPFAVEIPPSAPTRQSGFLSEKLILRPRTGGSATFLFGRGDCERGDAFVRVLVARDAVPSGLPAAA